MSAIGQPTSPGQNTDPRGHILIAHTNSAGTLVTGTQRGDGSRDALRAARLRWSRNLGAWFMPQSRGFAVRRERIDSLAAALTEAGFTVTVNVEEYDAAVALQARQDASEDRADALAAKAARERGRSDERHSSASAIVAAIPPGQPILVGHHSEARHRRDLARHDKHMRAAVEHAQAADRAAQRSRSARSQAAEREDPVVMGRKKDRIEAEKREIERRLASAAGDYAARLRERMGVLEADLAFLRESIERSGARQYAATDFRVGDFAQIRGSWLEVVRVNPKTLAVQSVMPYPLKYRYHEVTGHRRTIGQPAPTGDA
jgi:hypothetical protein